MLSNLLRPTGALLMEEPHAKPLHEIAAGTRYPLDAFQFVRRGLDFTVHRCHEKPEQLSEAERHVSGEQLCTGLRDFALEQYGRLARTVLGRWRINATEDFGQIVFAMVEGGMMQTTERDTLRDFENVFSFDESFDPPIPVDQVPLDDPHHASQRG